MARPVLQLAAAGILGVAVWKVLSVLLFPLLGTFLGLLFTVLKFALLIGLVALAFRWLSKKKGDTGERGEPGEATAE
ncbi:MAG: hypothetical protein ACREMV_08780 [Gemmatimonadales bacterium]